MLTFREMLFPPASTARTATVNGPVLAGVPVTTPELVSERPGGIAPDVNV